MVLPIGAVRVGLLPSLTELPGLCVHLHVHLDLPTSLTFLRCHFPAFVWVKSRGPKEGLQAGQCIPVAQTFRGGSITILPSTRAARGNLKPGTEGRDDLTVGAIY